MPRERDAVRQIARESVGIITPLPDSGEILALYEIDFAPGKNWVREPIGEYGPCGIENLSAGPDPEQRPVGAWSNDDLAAESCHRPTKR